MEHCTAQMSRVLGVRFGRLCESSLAIASVLEAGNMATSQCVKLCKFEFRKFANDSRPQELTRS